MNSQILLFVLIKHVVLEDQEAEGLYLATEFIQLRLQRMPMKKECEELFELRMLSAASLIGVCTLQLFTSC